MYTVKKRNGVWVVDTDGNAISFENYLAAIDTAQGAADVVRRSKTRPSDTNGTMNNGRLEDFGGE